MDSPPQVTKKPIFVYRQLKEKGTPNQAVPNESILDYLQAVCFKRVLEYLVALKKSTPFLGLFRCDSRLRASRVKNASDYGARDSFPIPLYIISA